MDNYKKLFALTDEDYLDALTMVVCSTSKEQLSGNWSMSFLLRMDYAANNILLKEIVAWGIYNHYIVAEQISEEVMTISLTKLGYTQVAYNTINK